MNEDWIPGGEKFPLYWAVSVPLVAIVALAFYLIGLGYKKVQREDTQFQSASSGSLDLEKGGVRISEREVVERLRWSGWTMITELSHRATGFARRSKST